MRRVLWITAGEFAVDSRWCQAERRGEERGGEERRGQQHLHLLPKRSWLPGALSRVSSLRSLATDFQGSR